MLERCGTTKITNATKASPYWKCIHDYYQEYKSYVPYKIAIDCNIDGESSKENATSLPAHMMQSEVGR
jgi:hypothetical protein